MASDLMRHVGKDQYAHFQSFSNSTFIYRTDSGLVFPIPLDEVRDVTLNVDEKAITFMKWIKRQLIEQGKM